MTEPRSGDLRSRFPAGPRPVSEIAQDMLRRQAWEQYGIVTVRPEEIADDWLRAGVQQWAARKWGRRK